MYLVVIIERFNYIFVINQLLQILPFLQNYLQQSQLQEILLLEFLLKVNFNNIIL